MIYKRNIVIILNNIVIAVSDGCLYNEIRKIKRTHTYAGSWRIDAGNTKNNHNTTYYKSRKENSK